MRYETLLYDLSDGIAEIRLNRPQRLNAVTQQLYDELNDALLRLIALMNAQGVEIKDTLPLSQSSPYVYDTANGNAKTLSKDLVSLKWISESAVDEDGLPTTLTEVGLGEADDAVLRTVAKGATAAGETIHTENSYKFTVDGFARLAAAAGWRLARSWVSPEPAFAIVLLD